MVPTCNVAPCPVGVATLTEPADGTPPEEATVVEVKSVADLIGLVGIEPPIVPRALPETEPAGVIPAVVGIPGEVGGLEMPGIDGTDGEPEPGVGAVGVVGGLIPSFSKVNSVSLSPIFTFTEPAISSIEMTSICPSLSPSFNIFDSGCFPCS